MGSFTFHMKTFPPSIFSYITVSETEYQTNENQVMDNWTWNMRQFLTISFLFKHSKFSEASNELKTKQPFKNIVIPVLEFRYAAEDRDVKDILFETEDTGKQHLSLLIKKYWDDVFTVENNLDDFIDDAIEEKIDYGGTLIKKGIDAVPEVISLHSIAFCDQTDIMGGPIGLKFNFSPAKLKAKANLGWGDTKNGADISIDELIRKATQEKDAGTTQEGVWKNKTTGKNIEVYVVRGWMPSIYLKGEDAEKMVNMVWVGAFYHDKNGRQGVTLFKNQETEEVYKFHNPKKIFNRAVGLGGVEVLFDAQVWTNFAEIHKKELLQAASKVIPWTTDENLANRQKIRNMQNLEWVNLAEGKQIGLLPTASPNIALFTQYLQEWDQIAQSVSGVSDPLLGKQPPAGTPFRLQERVVFEGKKPHERTAGKFDKFLEEIIVDWIMPHIVKKITQGTEFLSTLSVDEMNYIMEKVPRNRAIKTQWEQVLNGQNVEDLEVLTQRERENLARNGNRQVLEILKDEFKNVKWSVKVRVSSKQKDMALFTDKLVNVLRQYLSTPQLREDPIATEMMGKILEASGMPPASLGKLFASTAPTQIPTGVAESVTKPIKEMAKREVMV